MRKTKNNNTISTNNLNDHDKKPKKDDISNDNDKTLFQEMDIKQSNTCPELLNLQPSINEKNKLSFDSNLKLPKSYSNLTNFQEEKDFSQSQTQPQENSKPLSLKEKWISTPIEDEKVSPNQDINLFLDTTETFDQSAMVMQYTLFNPENIDKIYIPPSTEFDQFFEENFDNENDFYDSLSNEDLENSNSEYQNELTDSQEYDFYY